MVANSVRHSSRAQGVRDPGAYGIRDVGMAENTSKPVSSHPAFPLVIAIWFTALFGLGSLMIRPSLIESVVLATRLDALVPAAAPPLGITARILLALVMSALGCVLGLFAGRRLAGNGAAKRKGRRMKRVAGTGPDTEDIAEPDAGLVHEGPPRRPLLALQDLGASSLDAQTVDVDDTSSVRAGRRRALSVTDETRPSEYLDRAPLPGGGLLVSAVPDHHPSTEMPAAEPVASLSTAAEAALFMPPPSGEGPTLDWSQAAPVQPVRPFDAPPAVLQSVFDVSLEADDHDDEAILPLLPTQIFEAPQVQTWPVEADGDAGQFAPPAEAAYDAQDIEIAEAEPEDAGEPTEGDELELVDLREPADDSPGPVQPGWHDAGLPPTHEPIPAPEMQSVAIETPPAPAPAVRSAAENLASPNLAELGMVELAERLARAMQARRDRRPEEQDAVSPAATFPDLASIASAEPAPQAQVSPQASAQPAELPVPKLPAVLRPFDPEQLAADDDEEVALPSLLTGRITANPVMGGVEADEDSSRGDAPQAQEYEEIEEIESDDAAGSGCGSLLDMGRQPGPRQHFIRIENEPEAAIIEPVVVFPGQTPTPAAGPRPFDPPGTIASDMPSGVVAGQAPLAASNPPQVDGEEAERALRAALSSLQRISGAA